MENIIDCGDYGYMDDGDCFVVYEWTNGWEETGLSFSCSESEIKEFCRRYRGYGACDLYLEIVLN